MIPHPSFIHIEYGQENYNIDGGVERLGENTSCPIVLIYQHSRYLSYGWTVATLNTPIY